MHQQVNLCSQTLQLKSSQHFYATKPQCVNYPTGPVALWMHFQLYCQVEYICKICLDSIRFDPLKTRPSGSNTAINQGLSAPSHSFALLHYTQYLGEALLKKEKKKIAHQSIIQASCKFDSFKLAVRHQSSQILVI